MSAEEDFYTKISTSPGVTALVGDRIYPDALPEECAYPAVVFSRAGTTPIMTIDSVMHGEDVQIAVAVWANKRSEADEVADEVVIALAGSDFVYQSREAMYDPEVGMYASNIGLNYRDWETDRKSTRLNSSHSAKSRMPSSA